MILIAGSQLFTSRPVFCPQLGDCPTAGISGRKTTKKPRTLIGVFHGTLRLAMATPYMVQIRSTGSNGRKTGNDSIKSYVC